jgi:hypothetical protein
MTKGVVKIFVVEYNMKSYNTLVGENQQIFELIGGNNALQTRTMNENFLFDVLVSTDEATKTMLAYEQTIYVFHHIIVLRKGPTSNMVEGTFNKVPTCFLSI